MANEYFTDEEMKEHKITDYLYKEVNEKFMINSGEVISVWDYRENHKRFRDVLDGKSLVFAPYLPMTMTSPIKLTKDNLFKK